MKRGWLVWMAAAAGCFRPSPPGGAPCSPNGSCPDGFLCTADDVCAPHGGSGGPGDGGADGPSGGDLLRVHARVGVTVVAADGTLQEATEPSALAVVLADGTSPELAQTSDGSVEFHRAAVDQAYRITSGSTQVVGTTSALVYMPPVFGRTNVTPMTKAAPIAVTLDAFGQHAAGSTVLVATGQRAFAVNTGSNDLSFSLDWRTSTTLTGGPGGLLDGAAGGLLWLVHFVADSESRNALDGALALQVAQTDGDVLPVSGTLLKIDTTGCLRIAARAATERARLGAAVSGQSLTAFTGVASQPAALRVTPGAFVIASAPVTANGTADHPYAEPFPNEQLLAMLSVTRATTHQPGGGNASLVELATLISLAPVAGLAHACTAGDTVTVPAAPALLSTVTLDGVALTADRQAMVLDASAPVTVAVTVGAGGADRYQVELDDVTSGARVLVGMQVSAAPRFVLDRARFVAGHMYQLFVGVATGYAGVAQGDLTTPTYPVGVSETPSYTFRVAN